MSPTQALDIATGPEVIVGASLQVAIDALLAMAASLDADIGAACDVESVQQIGRAQSDLNNQAMSLVTAQIDIAAGDLRITAGHIDAAARYAQEAVAKMADWKRKITAIGKVLDFFATVMTGNGAKILESAIRLKAAL